MIKLLIAGRKAPGRTREAALAHLKTVHGPLVYDAPANAGAMPSRYVQNHVFDMPSIPALAAFASDRDLVTEVWFDDMPHLMASTKTSYYTEQLQSDESNFVDQASVLKAIVAESGARGARPEIAVKLFVFLKRAADIAQARLETEVAEHIGGALGRDPRVAAVVLNTPLPPPGGGEPYADIVPEFWFEDRAAAESFHGDALVSSLSDTLAAVLDPGPSFCVAADEYPVARLRAEAGRP